MDDNATYNFLELSAYECCELCPRRCRVNRSKGERGICGEGATLRAARAALHLWEEPPISGNASDESVPKNRRDAGSGAIFFSGCPLRCVYCQNYEISAQGAGIELSPEALAQSMLALQAQGALNINLVTALHFAPSVVKAVDRARKDGLCIPIVANTSGYERPELIESLAATVDIWLTDFKYLSPKTSSLLSHAKNYSEVATSALGAMLSNLSRAGGRLSDAKGHMLRGIIVRHLMVPGFESDSFLVLERLREVAGDAIDLSLMNQYTPNKICRAMGGRLSQKVDPKAYEALISYSYELGFSRVWWQMEGTVSESFIPAFDGSGLR